MEPFPSELFEKSCLIYKKGSYGIFYLTGKDGNFYTVKVTTDPNEIKINEYIKRNTDNPNILIVKGIYTDTSPIYNPLFSNKYNKLENPICKDLKVEEIFSRNLSYNYFYYLTEACLYNLGYYLGAFSGSLTYQEFVNYTFEILSSLQTLHSLNIWHRDIKAANFLICQDKDFNSVKYILDDKSWKISNINNRYIKLIDFGESVIVENVTNPCKDFQYEVNVALKNVIQLMWRKVEDKSEHEDEYNDLIDRMKNCETSLSDIILNVKIFDNLISDEPADITVFL